MKPWPNSSYIFIQYCRHWHNIEYEKNPFRHRLLYSAYLNLSQNQYTFILHFAGNERNSWCRLSVWPWPWSRHHYEQEDSECSVSAVQLYLWSVFASLSLSILNIVYRYPTYTNVRSCRRVQPNQARWSRYGSEAIELPSEPR